MTVHWRPNISELVEKRENSNRGQFFCTEGPVYVSFEKVLLLGTIDLRKYTHEDHLFELLPIRVSPKKDFLNPLGVPEVKRQTD